MSNFLKVKNTVATPSMVIPNIRRVYPQLISQQIVSVQPMTAPVGHVFHLRTEYVKPVETIETVTYIKKPYIPDYIDTDVDKKVREILL